MEGLLKHVWKLSGKEELGSFREGITQPQRTTSFTGERKPPKWLKRQFSRQMSSNHSIDEAEYAAAIAAAAFAIKALDSNDVDQVKPELERRPSLSRIISGLINPGFSAEPPKRHADENEYETTRMPKKRLTFADELAEDHLNPSSVYGTPVYSEEELEDTKIMEPSSTPPYTKTPTMKKTPSFDEEELEVAHRMKPSPAIVKKAKSFEEETMEEAKRMKSPKRPVLQPVIPPPIPPPPAIPPLNIQPVDPPKRAHRENDADAWEREEMAKIKHRYEKLNTTIQEWEDKKKKKARRKLERAEKEPEKKRVKAMHNYQLEMERIKQIAEGARAQAKGKYRNEELKVREKASMYRATGDPPQPPTCLCL